MSWCSYDCKRLTAKGRRRRLRSFGLRETASSANTSRQATLAALVVSLQSSMLAALSKCHGTKEG